MTETDNKCYFVEVTIMSIDVYCYRNEIVYQASKMSSLSLQMLAIKMMF